MDIAVHKLRPFMHTTVKARVANKQLLMQFLQYLYESPKSRSILKYPRMYFLT